MTVIRWFQHIWHPLPEGRLDCLRQLLALAEKEQGLCRHHR